MDLGHIPHLIPNLTAVDGDPADWASNTMDLDQGAGHAGRPDSLGSSLAKRCGSWGTFNLSGRTACQQSHD